MGKKLKGKQKQEEKPASANTDSNHFAKDQTPAIPAGDNFQTQSIFNPPPHAQNNEWPAPPPVQSGEWASTGWDTPANPGPVPWGEAVQEVDNSDDGESTMLQPPPAHTHSILPTIHEQPSGILDQRSTANSELEENQDYDDDYPAQDFEMPRSQTNGTTAVPSAMGSPGRPYSMSLAAVAAAAQQTSQKKTSSASEAARRLEEQRARINTPNSRLLEIPDNTPPARQPMSSASAQAALHESSTLKRRSARTKPPENTSDAGNKTRPWVDSPPLFPGAKPPGRITPDPTWTTTGGNAWSNKHRPGGGWVPGQESGWAQENRKFQQDRAAHHQQQQQQQQKQQHQRFHPQPQSQPSPTHQKYHSHPGPQPQRKGQNASWQGWGKEKWDQSDTMATDIHDEAVNWDSQHQHNAASAAWGQYTPSNQGGPPNHHRKKKEEAEWGQHNAAGAAWGASGAQYERMSGQHGENRQSGNEAHWGKDQSGGATWEQAGAPAGGGESGWDQYGGNAWGQTGGGSPGGGEWDYQQGESTWPETQNHNSDPVWGGHSGADWGNDIKSKSQSKDPKSTQQAHGKKQTKHQSTAEQEYWGTQDTGWGEEDESEYDEDGRRVRFSKASNVWAGSPHTPSKTITHAQISPTLLSDLSKLTLIESKGTAFENVRHAFFGNARLARERFHWSFPANKDERVAAILGWMQKMAPHIGKYGLLQFCQTREKGGIFINAAFRLEQHPNVPAFDYLTFDHLRSTMDKTLQESVAFYNPSVQAIVFVYLPSQSGNSVAIWRRKIDVPEQARMQYQADINAISRTLRKDKEYVCYVDEIPRKKKSGYLRKTPVAVKANAKPAPPPASTKKKKWWKFFLS